MALAAYHDNKTLIFDTPFLDVVEMMELSGHLQEPRRERVQRYSRKIGVDPIRKDIRVRRPDGHIPADVLTHISAMVKDADAIKLLVNKYEPNLSTTLDDGWMPLHRAARSGSTKALNILAAAFSYDKNKYLNTVTDDTKCWTLLHIAVLYGNENVVRLIASQFDDEVQLAEAPKFPKATSSTGKLVENKSSVRDTLGGQNIDDTMFRDSFMPGTIHNPSDTSSEEPSDSNPEKLPPPQKILWTGVNPNVWAAQRWTPMHCAALNGHANMVDVLLDITPSHEYKRANIDARDIDDWTPLHLAAHNGNLDVVKRLLQRGAKVNAKSRIPIGGTPLYLAIWAKEKELDKDKKKSLQQVIVFLKANGGRERDFLDRYFGFFTEMSRSTLQSFAGSRVDSRMLNEIVTVR
ncbi:ankyrin repeat-containing domain protein [Jimgerdemannia flammicorona]|uniref:Ankyrin repeat-containing domain protein n=1 Tax=Jimgerdemannia flammicorona TaxID=994334 RepID=A0A433QP63_9FUNG|nr:ankyrin repeat-containing domain protein [Jimgerdemannia flammicorona]